MRGVMAVVLLHTAAAVVAVDTTAGGKQQTKPDWEYEFDLIGDVQVPRYGKGKEKQEKTGANPATRPGEDKPQQKPDWEYEFDLVGDVQVPRYGDKEKEKADSETGTRSGAILGASPLTSSSQLFPRGETVHYVIDSSLGYSDSRVAAAVRHWEGRTCFRFQQCQSDSGCPRPYLRFVSGGGCSSPVGQTRYGVNQITLASGCGTGAAIHEVGHSLGLSHEQSRKDRDSFVRVDFSQVQRGMENNFEKNSAGHDLGEYDYGSIMHYGPNGFATGYRPTIVAPRSIGQRNGLSSGDVAAIEFLYNECSATFSAPRCMASVSTQQIPTLAVGSAWDVDFSVVYDPSRSVQVTFGETTVPSSAVQRSAGSGATLRDMGVVKTRVTPTRDMSGRTYVVAATFTGSDGSASTCSVQVRVEGTATGPAPTTPTAPPTRPNTPTPPAPGPGPSTGSSSCARVTLGFDSDAEVGNGAYGVTISRQTRRSGAGSLMFTQAGQSIAYSLGPLQPVLFSAYVRVPSYNTQVGVRLEASSGAVLYLVHAANGRVYFNTRSTTSWSGWTATASATVRTNTFQWLAVKFDWASAQFQVYVDRRYVGGGDLPRGLDAISQMELSADEDAPAYIDDVALLCQ